MATVTINCTMDLPGGARLLSCSIVGTTAYVRETGDGVTPTTIGVTSNAVIMVHPTGPSNGGYSACWSNALNALLYYGSTNIGAVGATTYNGQPLIGIGNAVNLATHTFPALILVKPG